jgi:hypothetical protein
MKFQEMLKDAHSNKKAETPAPKHTEEPTKAVNETASTIEHPPLQRSTPSPPKMKRQGEANLPTGALQIAREDVDPESYGIKPVATNFNCYNKKLFTWLKSFSSDNQFNGGVPITKSQVIEIMLDVMMYDLDINPIGYESQAELREDIQRKIKEF